MDPNETLKYIRKAIEDYDNAGGYGAEEEAADRVVQNFRALDEWICKGGFLPDEWICKGFLPPHEFTEDVSDASMCVCGIPVLSHDLIVHDEGAPGAPG